MVRRWERTNLLKGIEPERKVEVAKLFDAALHFLVRKEEEGGDSSSVPYFFPVIRRICEHKTRDVSILEKVYAHLNTFSGVASDAEIAFVEELCEKLNKEADD